MQEDSSLEVYFWKLEDLVISCKVTSSGENKAQSYSFCNPKFFLTYI